jgi:HK97 family phage major capsid protein
MGLLPDYAWPGAKWYCSNYAAATLFARLGAIGGGTIMTQAGRRPQLMYAGVPIVQTSKMNSASSTQAGKVMLILGDASMATMLGYDRQMTITSSTSKYLELDQIAVRATSRFSIVSHSLGDNSTPGAMVALLGGS